jgi:hypothetical protein
LSERAQEGWRWRGRCVKLVDGTGILMPCPFGKGA